MKKDLTERQDLIFNFIKDYTRECGFPPTVREIGDEFGITVKGAYDHLKAIEKKGYIRCTQNKSRAIELLDRQKRHCPRRCDADSPPWQNSRRAPILAQENVEEYLSFSRLRRLPAANFLP